MGQQSELDDTSLASAEFVEPQICLLAPSEQTFFQSCLANEFETQLQLADRAASQTDRLYRTRLDELL